MTTKPPVLLNGQKVGRFLASLHLFKETWRFLRLDPDILAIPFIAGLLNILMFVAFDKHLHQQPRHPLPQPVSLLN